MNRTPQATKSSRERVLLCGVLFPDHIVETEGPLTEAAGLVAASGAEVVGESILQRRDRANPSTLMGKGKAEEIKVEIDRHQPDAVVVDNELSPAQVRNLEQIWGLRVVDRSELILDIFSRRAQTRQARLQVELAQNEYLMPRLRRMWTHLERMEGAIGTRGPGETQLETDRRLLNKRIHDLQRELKGIEARRLRQVKSRSENFTIGLVGYTNAGKSTLLNRLTGAEELAEDMLFATLDTRTRKWLLADGRCVLLSDTVGFLQRLPHHLVASFHATLEETLHADLLLHIVDASHPDALHQMEAVEQVLGELSFSQQDKLVVFNKLDRVEDQLSLSLLQGDLTSPAVRISAGTGEGIDELEATVTNLLNARSALIELRIPLENGRLAAIVRSYATVLEEETIGDSILRFKVRVTEGGFGALRREGHGAFEHEVLERPTAGGCFQDWADEAHA